MLQKQTVASSRPHLKVGSCLEAHLQLQYSALTSFQYAVDLMHLVSRP